MIMVIVLIIQLLKVKINKIIIIIIKIVIIHHFFLKKKDNRFMKFNNFIYLNFSFSIKYKI